jgi:uncharacterized membrane protein
MRVRGGETNDETARTSALAATDQEGAARPTAGPPKAPGFLLGVGLGGFVDGIVLHQVLQWHHLLTDEGDFPMDTVRGLEDNTLADGLFHAATWFFVVAGLIVTINAWQRGRLAPPWRSHVGMMLIGWGVFNLVEGLVDHHILGIHHVRDDLGGPPSWDIGFLAFGTLLVSVGIALTRSGSGLVHRPSRTGTDRHGSSTTSAQVRALR